MRFYTTRQLPTVWIQWLTRKWFGDDGTLSDTHRWRWRRGFEVGAGGVGGVGGVLDETGPISARFQIPEKHRQVRTLAGDISDDNYGTRKIDGFERVGQNDKVALSSRSL